MGRRASVRYWASRGAYCCEFRGKQVVLARGPDDQLHGPTYAAALKAFGELITGQRKPPSGRTYSDIWAKYCSLQLAKLSPKTKRQRDQVLRDFMSLFGDQQPEQVDNLRIEAFIQTKQQPRYQAPTKQYRKWGVGSIWLFWQGLSALLHWAVEHKLISEMPVKIPPKPRGRAMARDCALRRWEVQSLLSAETHPTWRDYWIVLAETGCRPGEAAHFEAKYYDDLLGAIVFPSNVKEGEYKHKNYHHGVDRVIHLSLAAKEIVLRRMSDYPRGPIFGHPEQPRKQYPRPGMILRYYTDMAVTNRAFRLRRFTGVRQFIAYSFRHTFATEWLMSNRSAEKLAVLMGNSPAVIYEHYSHIIRYRDTIGDEYRQFSAEQVADKRKQPRFPDLV